MDYLCETEFPGKLSPLFPGNSLQCLIKPEKSVLPSQTVDPLGTLSCNMFPKHFASGICFVLHCELKEIEGSVLGDGALCWPAWEVVGWKHPKEQSRFKAFWIVQPHTLFTFNNFISNR
jgi:hypothetical protein